MEPSRFLWPRLAVSLKLLVIIIPAYLLNVAILALTFAPLLGAQRVWTWAAISMVTGGTWLGVAWGLRRPGSPSGARASGLAMAGFALVLALLYSWFLRLAFPTSAVMGQQVLAGFSIAALCLGAITLATLPWAALAWILGLSWGILTALTADREWGTAGHWAMLLSLFVVLGLIVVTYRRLFRDRVRAELDASQQAEMVSLLLRDFESDAQDWVWETDALGRLRGVSVRFSAVLGRSPADLQGRSLVEVLAEDGSRQTVEDEEDLAALAAAFTRQKPFRDLEVPVLGRTQYLRWRLSGRPLTDENGKLSGWRGVGSDLTEVQRLNNLNARLALLDNLTGLANRNRLQAVLHDHLSPRHGKRPCGLIFIDLQGFRMVNEGLGHEVGDELLRAVAQRLRSRVPTSALLARLGGDEFALVAPGAGEEALESLVGALASVCEDPFPVDGHRLEVLFHMGVALAPRDAESAADLLKCAELALREAKRQNQGTVTVYRPEFGERARHQIRLQAELKDALIEGQFELHYQPQVRLTDGAVVGFEALVRWKHPSRGLVSPAEFIPILEETGLIVPLGLWILEAACREAQKWPGEPTVAVNVSAVQFASRTFLESVQGVLAATHFPAGRLELEITESVMTQDSRHIVQLLQSLRALGLSVALDDFGTGYSSLSYLRQLPLDKLKVDQSFVRAMDQDSNAAAIVRTVLELSKTLGLRTTAEGIELASQQAQLTSMGCDTGQGYLYSRPLAASAVSEFLRRTPIPW